jgi:hypothetical protein
VSSDSLPVVLASKLEAQPQEQRWLIEGLWARSAIGLLGGAPKCCKTWMGLDMAVSVASGTPALGHFSCLAPGPALVFLAEDALPQVRSRIEALCNSRGRDISALDLHVITSPLLRLDLRGDQERLAQTIETLRPRLVLLDPLVRLHRLDENSAAEISGLLGYFRDLQRRFDTAIVLVHHASKKQRSQPGQALRGSSDLHAIGDCNAYLARDGKRIALTIEHRAAPSPDPMQLELVGEEGGEGAHLQVISPAVSQIMEPGLREQILAMLARRGEPLTRAALRSALRVNNQRLGDALERLLAEKRVERTANGWTVP